jgi:hypothetical protein
MRLSSLLALLCLLSACTIAVAQQDSISFVAARTLDGRPVQRGGPVPMEVTLRYNLESHDSAILSLSTAQFRNPNRCEGGSGELVDAEQRVVQRGSGFITINITWSGDTGEHSKGRIYHTGSLSFMGMFWKDVGGGRGPANQWQRYGLYDFYNDYCVTF